MKFGFPSFGNIRNYGEFVVSFDKRTRNANWVFEHITSDRLLRKDQEAVDRTKCQFTEDSSIHPYFRATNEDYKSSGYDRGHLAAAGNYRHSQISTDQTFLLSNISPQVGKGFNRDAWNSLEKLVRAIARKNKSVYLCTGPLYLPQHDDNDGKLYVKYEVIGKNHVAVPTHFFKIVIIETNTGDYEQLSFVMPNKALPPDVPLKNYLVPVESVERAAGLLFFEKLPKNKLIKVNHSKR
ncbi:endonuclease G, mitochondrial-like [Liolophura sinensis]|uniref:endonuclease G, mitochondrial-like n=1 Tax=Liolophura sinensis TaxID=3198878 RepID=UPI0031595F68